MKRWIEWNEALTALAGRQPDRWDDGHKRVNRERPETVRVRIPLGGDREPDRADDRDKEDDADREHDEQDV